MRAIQGYDAAGNPVTRLSTDQEDANVATLVARAITALANNATFLANANPSTAQNAAQIKALTRQIDALIRLAIGQPDTITDA